MCLWWDLTALPLEQRHKNLLFFKKGGPKFDSIIGHSLADSEVLSQSFCESDSSSFQPEAKRNDPKISLERKEIESIFEFYSTIFCLDRCMVPEMFGIWACSILKRFQTEPDHRLVARCC